MVYKWSTSELYDDGDGECQQFVTEGIPHTEAEDSVSVEGPASKLLLPLFPLLGSPIAH